MDNESLISNLKKIILRIKSKPVKFYNNVLLAQISRRIYAKILQWINAVKKKLKQFNIKKIIQHLGALNQSEDNGRNLEESNIEISENGIYSIVPKNKPVTERIRSIDILRGLVILVMVFVNDAYSVSGAPQLFLHMKPGVDGMTIADWVFPAFLFVVGITMPFSFSRRIEKGETILRLWEHVVKRSLILLFVGFFMVNMYSIDRSGGMIEYHMWIFLMLSGIILYRIDFPHSRIWMMYSLKIVRTTGILLLIFLAFAYSSRNGTGLIQMRTQWWGIIGLIGWAYLISGTVYLLFRKLPSGILGTASLLYCVYIADKAGMFQNLTILNSIVNIGSTLGTQSAITVSGIALGKLISEKLPEKTHSSRITRALVLGAGFASAALMLHSLSEFHPMFRISKLNATPSWGLLSSAITVWAWVLIYFISDVSKENRITKILEYAGRNALMAFILSTLIIYGFTLLEIHFYENEFYKDWADYMGLWRSLFFSFAIVLIAGGLEKIKIRLKL
ncbi:MAG: DUF5009 domain-containing protein [Spirochaetes bacterium]|nr:DUF5009 domain-containing protein [Spirochaetota bacterium]